MKTIFLFSMLFIAGMAHAQAPNEEVSKFIALVKSQLITLNIGKIEEHFDQGYFKTLTESDYFDKDVKVGVTGVYQKCMGMGETFTKQEIINFFEQNKKLKAEQKELLSKMDDFNFIRSLLKVRIYPEDLEPLYNNNNAIIKRSIKGLIEVIVLDLPSGVGSFGKKYLETWKKTEADLYDLAKENTLNVLTQKFEKGESAKTGEEFYLLASDSNLFITSSILDLKTAGIPVGKYGTFVSVPNNGAIVALPLNNTLKIKSFSLTFAGLTNYMFQDAETKPLSNNLYWYNGKEIFPVDKDIEKMELIFPAELKKLMAGQN